MEVFYALLRDGVAEGEARDRIAAFLPHLVDFSLDDELSAMVERARMVRERRNLSYVDAVGYFIARKHKLRLLTRDPGFRGLPGVLIP